MLDHAKRPTLHLATQDFLEDTSACEKISLAASASSSPRTPLSDRTLVCFESHSSSPTLDTPAAAEQDADPMLRGGWFYRCRYDSAGVMFAVNMLQYSRCTCSLLHVATFARQERHITQLVSAYTEGMCALLSPLQGLRVEDGL